MSADVEGSPAGFFAVDCAGGGVLAALPVGVSSVAALFFFFAMVLFQFQFQVHFTPGSGGRIVGAACSRLPKIHSRR
jgi:hypothetical protein